MNLQEFLNKAHEQFNGDYRQIPRIYCNDGFNMSVQGSSGHYCQPRKTTNEYSEMEIGFPSNEEIIIAPYAEDKESLCNTVYGYVPVDLIQLVINKHKGIDEERTFN